MGCDIHLHVERLSEDGSKWVYVDEEFYDGRNYDLFAILANVRNGRGFAGIKTGEGFVPISEPRGLPLDLSEEVKAKAEYWDGDGHSHSHLTLSEVLGFDWTQKTEHRGWVTLDEWARWKLRGKPDSWSGGVGGGMVNKVDERDVAVAVEASKGNRERPDLYALCRGDKEAVEAITSRLGGGNVYTQVKWTEAYHKSCRDFWSDTIPRLLALGGVLTQTRLVFWFDN